MKTRPLNGMLHNIRRGSTYTPAGKHISFDFGRPTKLQHNKTMSQVNALLAFGSIKLLAQKGSWLKQAGPSKKCSFKVFLHG